MDNLSPDAGELRRPHPLAEELIRRLDGRSYARVLELGSGSGRNTAALSKHGSFEVVAIPDNERFEGGSGFDAAISTHALLHGRAAGVAQNVAAIARALQPQAPFYATFASTRDARFGKGRRIDAQTFAPETGEEIGVPHVYFSEPELRALLEPAFEIESLEETNVDEIVGRWAHAQAPTGSVHWFARLRKRSTV